MPVGRATKPIPINAITPLRILPNCLLLASPYARITLIFLLKRLIIQPFELQRLCTEIYQ